MRITRINLHTMKNDVDYVYGDAKTFKKGRILFLLEILTESGITGWGDWGDCIYINQTDISPPNYMPYFNFLIGRSIEEHTQLYNELKCTTGVTNQMLLALDTAFWDIKGKMAGLSLSDLLGGSYSSEIPVYASLQSYRTKYPDFIEWKLRLIQGALEKGFKQVKIKIGAESIEKDIDCIKEVSRFLSDHSETWELPFAVDSNETYTFSEAVRIGRVLDEVGNVAWFEEPIPRADIFLYQKLRDKIDTPIAGAEGCSSVAELYSYLKQYALDIVQPDIQAMGGISEILKAYDLIELFGLHGYQHCYFGCLERVIALHIMSTRPPWGSPFRGLNYASLEWETAHFPARDELFTVELKPNERGMIEVPEGPGLGIEIKRATIEKYRWAK